MELQIHTPIQTVGHNKTGGMHTYFRHILYPANLRGRKQVQLFLLKERYSLTTEVVNVYNHFSNELKRALVTQRRKNLELI